MTANTANLTNAEADVILKKMCPAYGVPIILRRGMKKPQVIGSGVAFTKQNRQFVITAAHVVDEFDAPDVSLYTFPDKQQPMFGNRLHVTGTYKHRSSDIGVLELANPLPQSQCDEDHCVNMSDLSQHHDVGTITFLVHGFPEASQDESPLMPGVIQCTHVAVATNYREMRDEPYGSDGKFYDGPTIILDYGPEIWQRYHMAYYTRFGETHHPAGLSGGGVWHIANKKGQLITASDTLKLVGIQSHCAPNDYLRAVPITEALEIIDQDILGTP